MKKIASAVTGIPLPVFYDDDLKDKVYESYGGTPRRAMTDVHDALRPVFGDDVFIIPIRTQYRELRKTDKDTLVKLTDVRFEEEADWIRSEGGVILHVKRPGCNPGSHPSEHGIKKREGDYQIDNDGTLTDLGYQVDDFLRWWVGPDHFW